MLNREVGFALNNGHRQPSLAGPKSATTGLMQCSNNHHSIHLVGEWSVDIADYDRAVMLVH